MSRTFLALLTALALATTACGGGNAADRDTTPARADRQDDDRDRDERRADRDTDADDDTADEGDQVDTDVTVTDQGNGETDLSITQQIRQAVVADDRLSFGAKNVAIITREGVVTLRGEVDTAEEHAVLQEIANSVEGVQRLDDHIQVDAD